jgi:cell division transport system ATP-binding protein
MRLTLRETALGLKRALELLERFGLAKRAEHRPAELSGGEQQRVAISRALANRKVPYFRRHIGSVFQDFRLLPSKTVYQNVAFSLQVIGSSRGFIQQAVPEALALVGLDGKAKRMPHELSGGEQQRVAIARAIVNRPKVLLADEPTGNLDPATSVDIMQLLTRINAGGTTVVMATHEAGFVDQMQRRVIELKEGIMLRDELGGGYGDTSSIPRLTPEAIPGAAVAAARTAVQEVQRQTVAITTVNPDAAARPARADVVPPAPADAAPTDAQPDAAPQAPASAEEPAPAAAPAAPRTNPIFIPDVQVDELGVADRLGLSDDDEEVGPTS